jgi:hypothetical protein
MHIVPPVNRTFKIQYKKIHQNNPPRSFRFIAFVALYLFAAWSISKITVSAEPPRSNHFTIL